MLLGSFSYFNIYSYGFIISLAIFLAISITEFAAKIHPAHLSTEFMWKSSFFVLLSGLLGARLYYVFAESPYFLANPRHIFYVWEGGLGIWGALGVGFLVFLVLLQYSGQPALPWFDTIAVSLPFAQAVGRIANILNSELLPYAPIEAGLMLILGIILALKTRKLGFDNNFALYLVFYGLVRFLLTPIHGHDLLLYQGINASVLFSIGAVITGTILVYRHGSSKNKK